MNKCNMLLMLTAALALLVNCSTSSDGGTATTAIGVSGTLSLNNSAASLSVMQMKAVNGDSENDSLAVSDYNVICATTTAPFLTGTSAVGTDGSFSVSIAGAAGQPMKCYLVDANGANKGDFLIKDTNSKDMNGNADISTTVTPTSDLNMGTVTFDPDAGEVTVPASAIASSIASTAVASIFDPTGAWTISSVDFTLPSGVRSTCTQAENQSNTCNGPPDGQQIYLKIWSGTKVADGSPIHGLQVWESASSYAACGSKIGLPAAVKTSLGVDFSSNGAADSEFSFPTSLTGFSDALGGASSVTLTENWKMSTATLQHQTQLGCAPSDVSIGGTTYSNAWVCGPDSSSYYQLGIGGGCTKDSDGSSVNLTDWSGITCPGSPSVDSNGIRSMSCSGNATINSASVAVHCSNKYAVATKSGSVYTPDTNLAHNFNYAQLTNISAGTLCSDSSLTGISQLQCYADYYWRSGLADSNNYCMPKVDTDWSTSDPAQFVKKDFRPNKLIFFDQYKPLPEGDGGAILTRQEHYQGVQVNGNSWVNCRVIDTGGLSIKKVSDTKLIATYTSSEITTSTAKPACLAKYNGSKKTFVFYLTK